MAICVSIHNPTGAKAISYHSRGRLMGAVSLTDKDENDVPILFEDVGCIDDIIRALRDVRQLLVERDREEARTVSRYEDEAGGEVVEAAE